jgi:hypothetical protein
MVWILQLESYENANQLSLAEGKAHRLYLYWRLTFMFKWNACHLDDSEPLKGKPCRVVCERDSQPKEDTNITDETN